MRILNKEILAESSGTKIVKLEVASPDIAKKARPGQFVVLMVSEVGERIPLTIVDRDERRGTITLIFQEVGLTTRLLGKMKTRDTLYTLVGPLGKVSEVKNYGKTILVGGGVGIAEIYPVAKGMKSAGNHLTTILGARTKDLVILEEELKAISDSLHVATDDGSAGKKGFTTDILEDLLNRQSPTTNYQLVYAVGPIPMMKKISSITKTFNIETIVSLNALMVDATGMCGCCRVNVGGETLFSCVDGPEFDAHKVDWDELEKRNVIYAEKEKHICKLDNL